MNWTKATKYSAILFACWLGAGCTEAEDTNDKGAEESPLTDGKSDSFFKPTEHGELNFKLPNNATMAEDELFHAWTFTLTGEATVTLQTEISQNLDTVMYVYHREDSDSSWGRYIKKNDDHGKEIWSRIELAGEAGEYRVIVKPFKSKLRGSFSVNGTCEGDGCSVDDNQCVANEFGSMPVFTRFTDGCMSEIGAVLDSPVVSERSQLIPREEHCSLDPVRRQAVEHYVAWWNAIAGFDDAFGWIDELEFNVEHTEHENGHVVWVDVQADEDGMRLIYDKAGKLLSVYQSNQSPTVDWFCGDDNAEVLEDPSAECYSVVQRGIGFDEADVTGTESGRAEFGDIEDIDIFGVSEAVNDYMLSYEDTFSPGQMIDYQITGYNSRDGEVGTEVILTTINEDSEEVTAIYNVIEDFRNPILVRRSNKTDRVVCE